MTPAEHSRKAVTLCGDDSRTNASCASGSMCSMPPAKKNPADTQLARESLRGSERQTKGTSPQPTMRQKTDRADRSRNAALIAEGWVHRCNYHFESYYRRSHGCVWLAGAHETKPRHCSAAAAAAASSSEGGSSSSSSSSSSSHLQQANTPNESNTQDYK